MPSKRHSAEKRGNSHNHRDIDVHEYHDTVSETSNESDYDKSKKSMFTYDSFAYLILLTIYYCF